MRGQEGQRRGVARTHTPGVGDPQIITIAEALPKEHEV